MLAVAPVLSLGPLVAEGRCQAQLIAAVMKIVRPSMNPKKKTMIKANDRIGDAPEISGARLAYLDGFHGAMIASA